MGASLQLGRWEFVDSALRVKGLYLSLFAEHREGAASPVSVPPVALRLSMSQEEITKSTEPLSRTRAALGRSSFVA
jgi:hypothetical protein